MKLIGKKTKKGDSLKPHRNLLGQIGRDPYSDWAVIFAVSFIVAVILVSIGIITLLDMDARLSQPGPAAPSAVPVIDTKTLTKVLQEFNNRATERPSLTRGYSGPSDPAQ